MAETKELAIERLGAQGDGIAMIGGTQVFVPFALPGESVLAEIEGDRARLGYVMTASPDRVSPVCRHFGRCGGCALQHLSLPAYLEWKRGQVRLAFQHRGIEIEIAEVVPCSGKRRRVVFSARRTQTGIVLGFHEPSSHELVDIAECFVIEPAIFSALPALRRLIEPVAARKEDARAVVTLTAAGLDVALENVTFKGFSPERRAEIARLSAAGKFARVCLAGDPVYEAGMPYLKIGKAEVVPPPGSFLQAVAEAEHIMAERVLAAAGKSKSVADLFCGLGAFAFRLAEKARVFATDNDKLAIAALQAAAKKASGLKPIEVRVRDIYREPLSATELNEFDCVVFDPPRGGADAQAKMIAKSKVKTVVAVSCNPATLARDARILIDGGYAIDSVTPIDQFLYSPHIEVVAVFRR